MFKTGGVLTQDRTYITLKKLHAYPKSAPNVILRSESDEGSNHDDEILRPVIRWDSE